MSSVLFCDGSVFDKIALEKQMFESSTMPGNKYYHLGNPRFIIDQCSPLLSQHSMINESRRHHQTNNHQQQHNAHGRSMTRANSDHHGHGSNRDNESPPKNPKVKQHQLERGRSQNDLRSNVGSADTVNGFMSDPRILEEPLNPAMERSKLIHEEMNELWKMSVPIEEAILTDKVVRLKNLLHLNGISKSTFRSYCVRVLDNAIIFPRYSMTEAFEGLDFTPTGIKVFRLADLSGNHAHSVSVEVMPAENSYNGMFGYNLINPSNRDVVLTSREADALAVFQATKHTTPALVLPDNSGPLSYDALPYLESFHKITIWLPANQYNRAKQFARRLNPSRCFIVSSKLSTFTPSEILSGGNANVAYEKISKLVGVAEAALFKDVETFETLRESAKEHVFGMGQVAGIVQWIRFSLLNHVLKGFRLGELTILSGPTGTGKTTFLSEYSLDLCEQNVSTLWCSFEIPNSRLVSILVHQYAKKDFVHNKGEFDFWYDKLLKLPMYFSKFEVTTPLMRITEAIDDLIMTHDIQHVIIDNLQFMLEATHTKSYEQQMKLQETFCGHFRKLAVDKNVHVTIVIHPNIEADENSVIMNSLFGSVKTSQQADNIFLIQRKLFKFKEPYFEKYLQVWKNRYAGEVVLGERLQMLFDHKSKCHRLVAHPKKSSN